MTKMTLIKQRHIPGIKDHSHALGTFISNPLAGPGDMDIFRSTWKHETPIHQTKESNRVSKLVTYCNFGE